MLRPRHTVLLANWPAQLARCSATLAATGLPQSATILTMSSSALPASPALCRPQSGRTTYTQSFGYYCVQREPYTTSPRRPRMVTRPFVSHSFNRAVHCLVAAHFVPARVQCSATAPSKPHYRSKCQTPTGYPQRVQFVPIQTDLPASVLGFVTVLAKASVKHLVPRLLRQTVP